MVTRCVMLFAMDEQQDELPWEKAFAAEVARLRTEAGMSQRALTKTINEQGLSFHQSQLRRIELGERPIRLNEAYVVAAALGRSVTDLLGGAGGPGIAQSEVARLLHAASERMTHLVEVLREGWSDASDLLDRLETAIESAERHAIDTTVARAGLREMRAVDERIEECIVDITDDEVEPLVTEHPHPDETDDLSTSAEGR